MRVTAAPGSVGGSAPIFVGVRVRGVLAGAFPDASRRANYAQSNEVPTKAQYHTKLNRDRALFDGREGPAAA